MSELGNGQADFGLPDDSALATIETQLTRAVTVIGPELARRLIQATSKVEALVKDGYNEFHKYHYPTIAQVRGNANRALSDAGLAIVPSIVRVGRSDRQSAQGKTISLTTVELKILIASEDGSVTASWVGESEDTGDKGVQKATSEGMKYFLSNLLLMPISEPEPDSERETQTRHKQPARPIVHWSKNDQVRKRFWAQTRGELGLSDDDVHAALGVDHLAKYPGTLADALNAIDAWITAQQAQAAVVPTADAPTEA